jgi:hypothetical protein
MPLTCHRINVEDGILFVSASVSSFLFRESFSACLILSLFWFLIPFVTPSLEALLMCHALHLFVYRFSFIFSSWNRATN